MVVASGGLWVRYIAGMSKGELLAEMVLQTKPLLARYLAGFNDVTHVRQTPDLPNHVAWCLGHLAVTMHRVSSLLSGTPWTVPTLPQASPGSDSHPSVPAPFAPADLVFGDGTAGSRDRGYFDIESVAFGSKPEERHDRFPTLERCVQVYNAAADRLAATVRAMSDEDLDRPVSWGQAQVAGWALVARMIFHNGFHTGQIADLRRALSFKSIM